MHRERARAGGGELLGVGDGALAVVEEEADLDGDGDVEPPGQRAHDVHAEVLLLEQVRAVAALARDPLRAAQVQVHSVALMLHGAGRGEEHLRVVAAELHHERPVLRGRLEHARPLLLAALGVEPRVHHRRVADVRAVLAGEHAKRQLRLVHHRREHALWRAEVVAPPLPRLGAVRLQLLALQEVVRGVSGAGRHIETARKRSM